MGLISAGTTIFDAGSVNAGGAMTFIKKITASSSSTISFVHGSSSVVFDGTYKEYLFTFNNLHPASNACDFLFNMSVDSGSNYNVAKTTTYLQANHNEGDTNAALAFREGGLNALHNETGFQSLSTADGIGNDNDQCLSGTLTIFNPASTTFVKHFMANCNHYSNDNQSIQNLVAGYCNTTSAINAIQFKMDTGGSASNTDSGDICLYGIS
jgi:hypothetical protein